MQQVVFQPCFGKLLCGDAAPGGANAQSVGRPSNSGASHYDRHKHICADSLRAAR